MTQRIVIIDHYYPDFIKRLPCLLPHEAMSYWDQLQYVLSLEFGTGSAYGRHLRALDWEVQDNIVNYRDLQQKWAMANGNSAVSLEDIALAQIEAFQPDVVFLQNVSFFSVKALKALSQKYTLAAQCSCPMPDIQKVRECDVIFTSFPHYVQRFAHWGVKAHYVPLAFNEGIYKRYASAPLDAGRELHDVVFIGGVGVPSHWSAGMKVLEAVAAEIPTAKFWGYGYDLLPKGSPIREKYQGDAWGVEMYDILWKAKICLNRHGEVAQGYTNNMRTFEATGMGAMLLTEESKNISSFFVPGVECVTYSSPTDAVDQIQHYLEHEDDLANIMGAGQERTLKDHTYSKRMPLLSDVLKELISVSA